MRFPFAASRLLCCSLLFPEEPPCLGQPRFLCSLGICIFIPGPVSRISVPPPCGNALRLRCSSVWPRCVGADDNRLFAPASYRIQTYPCIKDIKRFGAFMPRTLPSGSHPKETKSNCRLRRNPAHARPRSRAFFLEHGKMVRASLALVQFGFSRIHSRLTPMPGSHTATAADRPLTEGWRGYGCRTPPDSAGLSFQGAQSPRQTVRHPSGHT